jgi:hypothetical protein
VMCAALDVTLDELLTPDELTRLAEGKATTAGAAA